MSMQASSVARQSAPSCASVARMSKELGCTGTGSGGGRVEACIGEPRGRGADGSCYHHIVGVLWRWKCGRRRWGNPLAGDRRDGEELASVRGVDSEEDALAAENGFEHHSRATQTTCLRVLEFPRDLIPAFELAEVERSILEEERVKAKNVGVFPDFSHHLRLSCCVMFFIEDVWHIAYLAG